MRLYFWVMGESIILYFFCTICSAAGAAPFRANGRRTISNCFEIDDARPLNSSEKSLTTATRVVNCLINPMNHQVPARSHFKFPLGRCACLSCAPLIIHRINLRVSLLLPDATADANKNSSKGFATLLEERVVFA
jgi:hypothetical protein